MDLTTAAGFVSFVLIVGGLIFVHELGHFLAARRTGVAVEEFGFGFPPRLLGVVRDAGGRWRFFWGNNRPGRKQRDGEGADAPLGAGEVTGQAPAQLNTTYSLNWIPLGGFVKPAGEDDPTVPGGLASANKRTRFIVLVAGAAMNLLAAYLIFTLGFKVGWPDRVRISFVVAGSPAEQAGLMAEDIILSANETDVHYFSQIIRETHIHLGRPMTLILQRGDRLLKYTVTPRTDWPPDEGPMGIEMQAVFVQDYSWVEALGRAGQEIWLHLAEIITLPGRIVRGELPLATARPIGLKGIYDLTDQAVEVVQVTNEWYPLIQLAGLISVALAFTNLLPLPALDGGRILFVLLEAIRGRRVSAEREGLVHAVGFLVLLALMVVINGMDFINPVVPPR